MKIQKDTLLVGVIGLLSGLLIAGLSARYAVNNNHDSMMGMMGMHDQVDDHHRSGGMDEMVEELEEERGDSFDRAFITMMIEHHEGAIDMAKLAEDNAKHDEIKRLAKDIVTAQTKEIGMMEAWWDEWDYNRGYDGTDMMRGWH